MAFFFHCVLFCTPGLDPVDSDTEFSDNGSGYTSTEYDDYSNIGRSRHRGHRDVSITTTTTTTTVITTITGNFVL